MFPHCGLRNEGQWHMWHLHALCHIVKDIFGLVFGEAKPGEVFDLVPSCFWGERLWEQHPAAQTKL